LSLISIEHSALVLMCSTTVLSLCAICVVHEDVRVVVEQRTVVLQSKSTAHNHCTCAHHQYLCTHVYYTSSMLADRRLTRICEGALWPRALHGVHDTCGRRVQQYT